MSILRSELGRWLLVSLAVLALGVVGMARTPGTDAATVGKVAGFGFRLDGEQCYLTVTYAVDGTPHRFQTSHEQRWCDYRPLYRQEGSVVVYYDSSDPATATLTPRGDLPLALVSVGLIGAAVCLHRGVRRTRRAKARSSVTV